MSEARYPYVHVEVDATDAEDIGSILWDLGAGGVEERDETTLAKAGAGRVLLVASFDDEEDAATAVSVLEEAGLAPRLEFVVGDAWRDAWRQYFKPTRVATRLVVRPSWEPYDALPDDVVVTIDPGRAFGSGLHETTRLVLRALDDAMPAGVRVLDVGCGSGILAVAAVLLGASSALAVDEDPDAVEVCAENAAVNGCEAKIVAATTDVSDLEERFPFVVANIEARVLVPLAPAIAARVDAGGQLVLSGILRGQEDDVVGAYPGFTLVETTRDGEWVALTLRRS